MCLMLLVLGALIGFSGCSGEKQGAKASGETWKSPRIAALAKELRAGDRAATERFWQELKDKAPLVEPIAEDGKYRWVTYVWRGDEKTRNVHVVGGAPNGRLSKPLTRLMGSDVWYRTERLPSDARFLYFFWINAADGAGESGGSLVEQWNEMINPGPDPLNPRVIGGRSVAELPDAPTRSWESDRLYQLGDNIKLDFIESAILKETRTFAVYTPPGYDPQDGPYHLLVVLDGEAYGSKPIYTLIPTPMILDDLIAKRRIPPVVAVLVDNQGKRDRDLPCSAPFADFLANELVPRVRDHTRVGADPSRVIVCGSSFGGLCAAYCGLQHPDVFGNILSQSGSFQFYPGYLERPRTFETETGWLTRRFVTEPKLRLRFYLSVGRFEQWFPDNGLAENRRMRDVLEAKGYPVIYSEYDGGHDYLCWNDSLVDGLIALLGEQVQK